MASIKVLTVGMKRHSELMTVEVMVALGNE